MIKAGKLANEGTIYMDYKKFYRELILTTTGSLPASEDGMSETEFDALCKIAVPQALKEYYLVVGKHSISMEYNLFLPPDKFERHDGFLWFMEENQAVCYWGIKENDLMQTDPEVWQLHADPSGKLAHAYSEERTFSEFVSGYFAFLKSDKEG